MGVIIYTNICMLDKIENSFDTNTALSGIFLWLLFGLLAPLVNCDLQRIIRRNPIVMHMVSIIAFFFLFTVIDPTNKSSLLMSWIKTLVVYMLFMLATKSKWYFILPTLALLMVDQSILKHIGFEKHKDPEKWSNEQEHRYIVIRKVLLVIVIVNIVIGAIHYTTLQRSEYKNNFSWFTFFIGSGKPCKIKAPT
jgi:hypothetical protein